MSANGRNLLYTFRHSGDMISKVLRGSKGLPNLPIECRTAKTLRFVFPTSVPLHVNEVIEQRALVPSLACLRLAKGVR